MRETCLQQTDHHGLRAWQQSAGRYLLGLTVLMLLTGCSGYQLGEPAAAPASSSSVAPHPFSIYVPPPANSSFAPQVHAPLAIHLRESLLRRGLTLQAKNQADLLLFWEVTDYQQNRFSGTRTDTGRPRSIDLSLEVKAHIKHRQTGEQILPTKVFTARRRIISDSGLSEAQRQSLPTLADDLARQLADALVAAPPAANPALNPES